MVRSISVLRFVATQPAVYRCSLFCLLLLAGTCLGMVSGCSMQRRPEPEPVVIRSGMTVEAVLEQVRRIYHEAELGPVVTQQPRRQLLTIGSNHSQLVMPIADAGQVVGFTWMYGRSGEGLSMRAVGGDELFFEVPSVRRADDLLIAPGTTVGALERRLATVEGERFLAERERWMLDGEGWFLVSLGEFRFLLLLPDHDWRAFEPQLNPAIEIRGVRRLGPTLQRRAVIGQALPIEPSVR